MAIIEANGGFRWDPTVKEAFELDLRCLDSYVGIHPHGPYLPIDGRVDRNLKMFDGDALVATGSL
ncbi:hypothetical protein [Novipirellula artificiosorum]|uniref:Uncharacterized protein n=1 Tax=Novipirellula artificiosorum TaxID=2528016 RepID=A0A5C6DE98_9BACT|nr:hypothetical protein [Novipirellula artificiosorum]TWU34234.1 hypothetical protein Poly41_43800 [Novipirellula artificiosorum]